MLRPTCAAAAAGLAALLLLSAPPPPAAAQRVFATDFYPTGTLWHIDLESGAAREVNALLGAGLRGVLYDRKGRLFVARGQGAGGMLALVDPEHGTWTGISQRPGFFPVSHDHRYLASEPESAQLYLAGGGDLVAWKLVEAEREPPVLDSVMTLFQREHFILAVVAEPERLLLLTPAGLAEHDLALGRTTFLGSADLREPENMVREAGGDLLVTEPVDGMLARVRLSPLPHFPPELVERYRLYWEERDANGELINNGLVEPTGLLVDPVDNSVLMGDRFAPGIYRLDLATGVVTRVVDTPRPVYSLTFDTPVSAFAQVRLLGGRLVADASESRSRTSPLASYEWTLTKREPGQGTFSAAGPLVALSGLPWGVYDVVVKVTDSAGFSATASRQGVLVPVAPGSPR